MIDHVGKAVSEIDALIKEGKLKQAEADLLTLVPSCFNEMERLDAARLCRRLGRMDKVFRLLSPICFDDLGRHRGSTDVTIEYALSLSRIGCGQEAKELLGKLDEPENPQLNFSLAAANINTGDLPTAISHLEKQIALLPTDHYGSLVAGLNLANSYVYLEEFNHALDALQRVQKVASSNGYALIEANCFELRTKIAICKGDTGEASKTLAESEKLLKLDPNFSDAFYLWKWKIVLEQLDASGSSGSEKNLAEFVKQGKKALQNETLREVDLYLGMLLPCEDKLKSVYFGSPYESIRRKAALHYAREFSKEMPVSMAFGDSLESGVSIDAVFGKTSKGDALPKNSAAHRLLLHLAKERYGPCSTMGLNARVFPEKRFQPHSSLPSLNQAMHKLNLWFKHSKIETRVSVKNLRCSLSLEGVSLILSEGKKEESRFEALSRHFADRSFTRQEAEKLLGISSRQANRVLKEEILSGNLSSTGAAKSLKYSLTQKES